MFDFTGEESEYSEFISLADAFEKKLPKAGMSAETIPVTPEKKNEGLLSSSQVQYVCRAGNYRKDGLSYTGALRVLKVIMGYDYLWNQVRVKGGAYGCMSNFNRIGDGDFAVATRDIGTGIETCRAKLPALFTVTEKFGELRPFQMRRVMKYKNAEPEILSCADIGAEDSRCGFAGSPTSVNKIVSVVLAGGDYKEVQPTKLFVPNL